MAEGNHLNQKRILTFGEILLRLSTPKKELISQSNCFTAYYGGSESNVAIALSNLKSEVAFISALPQNSLGQAAISFLKSHGVDTSHLIVKPGRMGLYFLEQGAALRSAKVIYDRADSAFAQLESGNIAWPALFQGAHWFHLSGISAAVSECAAEVCLEAVKAAKAHNLTVSIDLNYRKNLWQYGKAPHEIMPELVRHADLLLADPGTANLMLNTDVPISGYYTSADELKEPYDALTKYFPNLKYISMLLRDVLSSQSNVIRGALYAEGKVWSSNSLKIEPIVERVGGGDAYMAGLIYGISNDKDMSEVVNIATSLSALKLTVEGDVCPFDIDMVLDFMKQDGTGKINR